MVQKQHYTFGDSDLAAARLRLLASVFEPTSSRLLCGLSPDAGQQGVDLGCGPGYTTALLGEHVPLLQVVGLDQSPRLLEQATRERGSARVAFAQCDVSAPPFPVPAASLLYSRFLLTHLRDPATVIRAWASAAQPAACLVLEETAFLTGEHPAFPRYYALVERMQAHYGQRMYIGRDLEGLSECPEWVVESAAITEVLLPSADMARLHFFNIQTWASDAFAQASYSASELAQLTAELEAIASGEVAAPAIACGMGQVVLRRR